VAFIIQLALSGVFMLFALSSFAAEDTPDIPHFDIKSYQVEGNTLFTADKVNSILAPFTGKGKDFGTVQEALEALEKAYHNRGYIAVQVALPEQELENGVVRLNVIETRIGKIKVEGNRFFDGPNILRSMPALREGQTPNINDVSRSLKIANESPAKKVNLQLQSSDKENEVDANLQVTDEKPWKVGITFDNTGDDRTGRFRIGALFQHANIFNRDQLLTLQYITSSSQPDHVGIYGMGYKIPFYGAGSSIDLIGAYSDVNSGTLSVASNTLQVSGKGTILGVHYNQNLTRIGNYEHKLTLGLDYRAYINNVAFGSIQLGSNVTTHPISLTYAGTLTQDKVNAGFYLGASRNLPGLGRGGRDTAEYFDKVRAGAPEGYNILRYGANFSYTFGSDWQARALVNGQLTNKPLVPGEQFGIGGASSVRGFDERAVGDDRGLSGSVELYTPNLCKLARMSTAQCRALVFYDVGHVSRINPLPGETAGTTISSAGPGVRITDGKYFSLSTDYGFIVEPLVGGKGRWSGRWHMMLSLMY
jgi:hemolysin activation/secretion protein